MSLGVSMLKSSFSVHILVKSGSICVNNKDQNDYRSIVHISSNTFHEWKCFIFVIICLWLLSGSAAYRSSHLAVHMPGTCSIRCCYSDVLLYQISLSTKLRLL